MGFIVKDQRPRRPLAAPLIALLIVTTPLMIPATADEASQEPLAVLRLGAPDSPAWMILRFEADRPGMSIDVQESFVEARCPSIWAFATLVGDPEDAFARSGVIHGSGSGMEGVEVRGDAVAFPLPGEAPVSSGPVAYSNVNRTGEESCKRTAFGYRFGIPVGVTHFMAFVVGEPFEGSVTVRANDPDLRVAASSFGSTGFYVEGSDFETNGAHAAVHSPKAEAESVRLAGGWAGGDVSVRRSTTWTFDHQPIFLFGTRIADVSDAHIEDPNGRIVHLGGEKRVSVRNGFFISFVSPMSEFPAGTYAYRVDASVSGGLAEPWFVAGVDAWFPTG